MTPGGLDIRSHRRIRCPRCGSNNFPGRPRCWQCGASLPPPEDAPDGPDALPAPAAIAPGRTPPRRDLLRSALWAAAALLVLGGVVLVARNLRPAREAAGSREQAELRAIERQMLHRGDLPGPDAPATDPVEARARRELERLRREAGLSTPPTDQAGRVHLGTGGTISAEEWSRARRALSAP